MTPPQILSSSSSSSIGSHHHHHHHHKLEPNNSVNVPLPSILDDIDPVKSKDTTTAATAATTTAEQDGIDYILKHLSPEELELAASTSYHYQKLKQQSQSQSQQQKSQYQYEYAYQMARRYLHSKSDPQIALQKLQQTLVFRQEWKLNDLHQMTLNHSESLHRFLSDHKAWVVQGNDNDEQRSTYIFIPRNVTDHSLGVHHTVLGHVWSLEKAIACSSSTTTTTSNTTTPTTVNIIVDFADFRLFSHTPPLDIGQQVMTTLRNHYVGHVHVILLLNVPSAFSILWSMFQSFAGTKTREKLYLASTPQEAKDLLLKYYGTCNQPWMKQLLFDTSSDNSDETTTTTKGKFNVDEYLNQLPFDKALLLGAI